MLSLYVSAFGSYAPNLFHLFDSDAVSFHVYASGIIIIATALNYYSLKIVGKTETYAVAIKLVILLAFVVIGIYGLFGNPNLAQLSPQNRESPINLITGGMVIFVAYEGFELIANAVPDIENSKRMFPKRIIILLFL